MATVITNYTTYDQAYYYTDLRQIPRYTEEERRHLAQRALTLLNANDPTATRAHHQLIESFLPLAKYFALQYSHRAGYHRDLPDLIGIANLTVVEILTRHDPHRIDHLTGYLAVTLKGKLKGAAVQEESVIKIPWHARTQAEGTDTHNLIRLESLDELMSWHDQEDPEEPAAVPIYPTHAAPPRDPQLRAQVEQYLSYLSPLAQTILRLRYGLSDEDERCYGTTEIARIVGKSRTAVQGIERDAIDRLHRFVSGTAKLVRRGGRQCISCPGSRKTASHRALKPEEERRLQHISSRLLAEGVSISSRRLAKAAGISVHCVRTYLRQHRAVLQGQAMVQQEQYRQRALSTTERARYRMYRLEAAYERLNTRNIPISVYALSKEAHVGKTFAKQFLTARREQPYV